MSAAGGFDPSLLDGKDRTELAAIAAQLGEKPPARAKKADIVALIMRLVGADASGAPAAGPADGATPSATEGGADARQAAMFDDAPATESPDEAGSGSGSGNGAGEDASGTGSNGGERRPARGEQGDRPAGGGQAVATPSPAGEDGRPRTGTGPNGNGNGPNGNGNGNAKDGGPGGEGQAGAGGGGGSEGQDGDEGEPGNRRRRRRGRDRDRRPEGGDDAQAQAEPVEVEGLVDLREEGYGFLRVAGYLPSRDDAYVSVKQTRQFGLRTGDVVRGKARPATRNEKNPALLQVDAVNGHQAHNQPGRTRFDELTAVFPSERLRLELADDPTNLTVRAIDLLAPIGKGQRALVVAPPKTGRTTLLKHLVRSIEVNHPDVELMVLLIDERPEEVTDMTRWLVRGHVASSAFDRPAEEHVAVADLAVERAKRLVEQGKDVVLVIDGITRLTRAHNLVAPPGGRVFDAGLDAGAVHPPKAVLGAARNAEEGGSLTIVATLQADSGSHLDEVILEEFAGTGNQEVRLDRALAEREVFPAISVAGTGTRHVDQLLGRDEARQAAELRRLLLAAASPAAAIELLVEKLEASKTNAALLEAIGRSNG